MYHSPQFLLFPFELTCEHVRKLSERASKIHSCPMMTVTEEYKNHNIDTWKDLAAWLEQHPSKILEIAAKVASKDEEAYTAVLDTFQDTDFGIKDYLKVMRIPNNE